MKRLADYTDRFGLVCTLPGFDGGDTLANEMTLAYCAAVGSGQHDSRHQLKKLFDHQTGLYRRHPDAAKWYSNSDCTSRDQLTPLLCYLAISNLSQTWWQQLRKLRSKGYCFAFNTRRNFQYPTLAEHLERSTPDVAWNWAPKLPDFLGPDMWAVLVRGTCRHLRGLNGAIVFGGLLPLILLGDLHLLAGAVHNQYLWRTKQKLGPGRAGYDHDDRCFALKLHLANHVLPTPLSRLARAIYGTARPLSCFKSFWADRPEEPPIDAALAPLYAKI